MAWAALLPSSPLAEPDTASTSQSWSTEGAPAALVPEQIRMVQRALAEKGYAVNTTGTWDDATGSALTTFQRSRELPATGRLDAATTRALGVDPAEVMPVRGTAIAPPAGPYDRLDPSDPDVNCGVNNTVDCRYGGGG